MRIGAHEFSMRELAGSMGDMGTFFPLAVGYFAVCGVDPCGLLVMMGLTNIATGLVYRLPMPVEPMKVVAVVAIAQKWTPDMVYAAGIGIGISWIILAATGLIDWIAKQTPQPVVRGIQTALGLMLAYQGAKLVGGEWALAIVALIIILTLRDNKYAPAAVVLVALGLGIMWYRGMFEGLAGPAFALPQLRTPSAADIWSTFLLAGLAQLPLTATNAVIATSDTISKLWPDRRVTVRALAADHGVINMVVPFFGGMSMCHGVGGLVGQHYYGARTGGTNIIEGVIEIALGLFLAGSIASIFSDFPAAIIGAMMFLVGLNMVKFAREVKLTADLVPLAATAGVSIVPGSNMAIGFVAGIAVYKIMEWRGWVGGRPADPLHL